MQMQENSKGEVSVQQNLSDKPKEWKCSPSLETLKSLGESHGSDEGYLPSLANKHSVEMIRQVSRGLPFFD